MFEPKDIDGGVSDHSAPVGCSSNFSVRSSVVRNSDTCRVKGVYVNPVHGIIVFFFFGKELESQIFRRIYVAEPTHVSL